MGPTNGSPVTKRWWQVTVTSEPTERGPLSTAENPDPVSAAPDPAAEAAASLGSTIA